MTDDAVSISITIKVEDVVMEFQEKVLVHAVEESIHNLTDLSLPQARRLQAQWTRRAFSLALAEFEIGLVQLAHKQYNCSKMITACVL